MPLNPEDLVVHQPRPTIRAWLLHNCVAHPLLGITGALAEWAERFHDRTVPDDYEAAVAEALDHIESAVAEVRPTREHSLVEDTWRDLYEHGPATVAGTSGVPGLPGWTYDPSLVDESKIADILTRAPDADCECGPGGCVAPS